MDNDVELAIRHAFDVAWARGGQLASLTLRGAGTESAIGVAARAVLLRLGVASVEVRFEADIGRVRLAFVELDP